MKYNIKPLKQTTEFGCLATSFTMVKNHIFGEENFNQDKESFLTSQAFKSETGFNEHFYLKKLSDIGCDIKVFIETPYMLDGYNLLNTKYNCNISVEHSIIDIGDIESLLRNNYVIITLVDLWQIDMIIHTAHYVVINGFEENSFYCLDPKYGKELRFSKKRFLNSIENLKQRLGYSPLIFAIKKKDIKSNPSS